MNNKAAVTLAFFMLGCVTSTTSLAQDHDGSHDFDFSLGRWTVRITRTLDPFQKPDASYPMSGYIDVHSIWEGKAHVEEMEVDGPKGHFEGMNLFLYNPDARQWSKIFASSRTGQTEPPLIGSFTGGVGEFFTMDTLEGRSMITRARWSNITRTSYDYDESYSRDGGKSWHVAFRALLKRSS